MVARCCNPTCKSYPKYGGAGIDVCGEWLGDNGFNNFYSWSIENGYTDDLTIDRIDGSKGYNPGNCRWVDYKTQNNNTKRNRLISYNGKTQTMAEWSEELGIPYQRLNSRINVSKMSIEDAFRLEKMNNRSRGKEINKKTEAFGTRKYLAEWAKEYELNPNTISKRVENGMSTEDAIITRKWQKISASKLEEIFDDYYKGVPVDVIYKKYGITSASLCRYRKRYGKKLRNNRFSYKNRKDRHGY